MSLATKAMLVKLSLSKWSTSKFDAKVTQAANAHFGAGKDAGRFTKALLAREADEEIRKTYNEARGFHYKNTLPWKDDGFRILPATNYQEYTREMRALKSKYESTCRQFVADFPGKVAEAQQKLNGMFNPADYPDPAELPHHYNFDMEVVPIPEGADFRVALDEEEAEAIRKDMERRLEKAQAEAMEDLWNRLYKTVEHIVERLSDPENTFRDSLIGNAVALVDLLPRLNVANDQVLENMRREIETKLCAHNPQEIRESESVRKDLAGTAEDILATMSGYMGGAA